MIFYSATRGTILGTLGGLFVAGILFTIFSKGQKNLRRWGAALAVLVLVIVGGFSLIKNTAFVQNHEVLTRLASISIAAGHTRFSIWNMALKGIEERPILGWGQENFNYVFNKYYQPSMHDQEPWFDRAHNQFLDITIAGGVVSLAFYLALFGFALWYLWRRGSNFSVAEKALLTGLIAGYAFHNLFVFDNLVSYLLFFMFLAYIAWRRTAEAPALGATKTFSPTTVQAASAASLIVLVLALWFVNVPGIARAANLIQGLKPHGNDLVPNFKYFKLANTGGGIGRQEAHEQLLQFAVQVQAPSLASLSTPQLRSDILTYTRDEFAHEIDREPSDARLRVFYGSFLRQIGDTAGAETQLLKAVDLSPNKQTILFELGILKTNAGDLPGALAWFKKAYDLDQSFPQARIDYAATLIRAKQGGVASQLLIQALGTATPDNDVLLQAYLDVGDYASVIAIAKGRTDQKPTDPNLWVQLGAAYLRANQRTDSIAALQKAIDLNPDFKAQGEYYIQEIKAGRNP
jgi:tetratricopeptide (TPR) repeat protein